MRLNRKIAVITGGSRGIGYATVETFLREGAAVILTASSPKTAAAAVEKLKAKYPNASVEGISPNLASLESVREAFRDIRTRYGRIDILVNNAGLSESTPLSNYTEELFDKVMDLNVKGVFNAAKAAADIAVRNAERALTKAQTAYDKAVLANDKAQADLKAMNDGGDPEEILAGDKKEETEEKPEEEGYQYTKYTSDNGMIVRVTYGNGVSFIINYNNFAVTVEGYTIGAYDGMKFNADGETVIESIRALTHGEAAAD